MTHAPAASLDQTRRTTPIDNPQFMAKSIENSGFRVQKNRPIKFRIAAKTIRLGLMFNPRKEALDKLSHLDNKLYTFVAGTIRRHAKNQPMSIGSAFHPS
jgi:hypothetical protein